MKTEVLAEIENSIESLQSFKHWSNLVPIWFGNTFRN